MTRAREPRSAHIFYHSPQTTHHKREAEGELPPLGQQDLAQFVNQPSRIFREAGVIGMQAV